MNSKETLEARQVRRVDFERDVEILGRGKTRSRNISIGGIFLRTPVVLPAGKTLVLRFYLSKSDSEQITADARVVFSRAGVGTGLEFRDLPDETRERLTRFITSG